MSGRGKLLSLLFVVFAMVLVSCTSLPTQIVDDFGVPMALVPAGEFKLTSRDVGTGETAEFTVYVDDFYIDLYEVTNQRYAECMDEGVCAEPKNTTFYSNAAYLDHPVVYVTWDMADVYCRWRGARLPNKTEWEKGARDELENVDYYWGDVSPVCQVGARMGAEIDQNADFKIETEPIGSYDPNTFGLYDMTGNVWEWVQDPYVEEDYRSSPSYVSFLRMANWSGYGPVYKRFLCGFRCARSP